MKISRTRPSDLGDLIVRGKSYDWQSLSEEEEILKVAKGRGNASDPGRGAYQSETKGSKYFVAQHSGSALAGGPVTLEGPNQVSVLDST